MSQCVCVFGHIAGHKHLSWVTGSLLKEVYALLGNWITEFLKCNSSDPWVLVCASSATSPLPASSFLLISTFPKTLTIETFSICKKHFQKRRQVAAAARRRCDSNSLTHFLKSLLPSSPASNFLLSLITSARADLLYRCVCVYVCVWLIWLWRMCQGQPLFHNTSSHSCFYLIDLKEREKAPIYINLLEIEIWVCKPVCAGLGVR